MGYTSFPLGLNDPTSSLNNYILNPNAETDSTSWNTYADAAGVSPVDGTGGSPSITLTRSTTSPLRGTASFIFSKDAVNRQGQGSGIDFSVASADQGQVLGINFEYVISSGTFADGDVTVWIYDVTNAVLLQPAPTSVLSTSVNTKWTGSFQTSINSTSYRLIFHVTTTSASAYVLKLDNVYVGQNKASGVIPKAPTIQKFLSSSGTYITPAGVQYIRVKMVGGGGGGGPSGTAAGTAGGSGTASTFSGFLSAGGGGGGGGVSTTDGATGGAASVTAPAIGFGVTGGSGGGGAQTSNTSSSVGGSWVGGTGGVSAYGGGGFSSRVAGGNGVTNTGGGGGGGGGGTNLNSNYCGVGGGAGAYLDAIINSPLSSYSYVVGAGGSAGVAGTGGNNGGLGGSGYVEVTEYYVGTNVLMSNETDTRVVAAVGSRVTSAQTLAPNASEITLIWNSAPSDTHASLNTSTGIFTAPVAGYYRLTSKFLSTSGNTIANLYSLRCYFNNTLVGRLDEKTPTAGGRLTLNGSVTGYLQTGQTIFLTLFAAGNNSASTITMETSPDSYMMVERIAGPAQIAASESVNARYGNGVGTVFSGTGTNVPWPTRVYDSHSAMNAGTGVYTVPMSGKYRVNCLMTMVAFSLGSTAQLLLDVFKSGSQDAHLARIIGNGQSMNWCLNGSATLTCLAGDTIVVQLSGGTASTLFSNTVYNHISIERVGN